MVSSLLGCRASTEKKGTRHNATFRVMTYNIHHGEGVNGEIDLKRIAEGIKKANVDIVALQEVDIGVERSNYKNIPKALSQLTGIKHYAFGKNLDLNGGRYGNAILSKFPIIENKNTQFKSPASEQRGVLQAVVQLRDTTRLLMLATHLDHRSKTDRLTYVNGIKNEILPKYQSDAVILAGDFNDTPGSVTYKKTAAFLKDSWVSGRGEGFTIPPDNPTRRIDYIFHGKNVRALKTWVPTMPLASDHLPVVTELTYDR